MEQTSSPSGEPQTALHRALGTIRILRRQLAAQQGGQPIAVVGIGLRLPGGVADLGAYWTALAAGADLVRPMTKARMGPFAQEWEGLPRRGGFLDEVLGFDAAFFGISPREARSLDPQHRLLLEVSWEALENAALPAARLRGRPVGFYVGITGQDYRDWLPDEPDAYCATGNGHCFAAGRAAYALGLTGPVMAVDTACSSSLVAIHLAMQALRRQECEVAIAGAVNLILSPRSTRLVQQTRSLAPDGICKAFDARANGFTRGEGCGAVVLKPLGHALRDGDRIHAVIQGSAVNHDGSAGGFTVPNVLSQVSLIESALADAGLDPSDIGYVEAHGTGTALGDPIEMEALASTLGRRNGGLPLLVGSVKSNLGHLEAAAGMAGLIKAVLCLGHSQVPPVVHFQNLNPRIDLQGTGMTVPAALTDWAPGSGRYAGISSFGMSGTNAHIILGAPAATAATAGDAAQPPPVTGFEVSAKSVEALQALAARYAQRAAELSPGDYAAFAYTVTSGRTRQPVRARITAADLPSAAAALAALAVGAPSAATILAETAEVAGAGDQAGSLPRHVIDLPAYPWQRQRYAPPEKAAAPAEPSAPSAPAALASAAPGQASLPTAHQLGWIKAVARPPKRALVLAGDDEELLVLLAREAAEQGLHGTVLSPVHVALPPGWEVTALPAERADWRLFWLGRPHDESACLVLALLASPLPDSASARPGPYAGGAALCAAAVVAATGLAEAGGERRQMIAVTRAVRRIGPGDRVAPTDHGLLNGLSPVLGLECGPAWGGIVDLPDDMRPADVRALVAFVAAEPDTSRGTVQAPVEDLAAVRAGQVLVARLRPAGEYAPELTVAGDATYVVTGGLGAVGREILTDLVRRGARNLLLIGRRSRGTLPPDAAAFLAGLRDAGARVTYRGDGCHTFELLAAACGALEDMPPVRGVIHAAGSIERSPADQLGADGFTAALRDKAAGAWLLHLAARDWPLDFFVLVSSVTALWGTEGYGAYAAANGALDALAAHRVSRGLPAVSIAYGPWALDGMADAESRARFARIGVGALEPAAACAALTERAPGPSGYVVACPLDRVRLTEIMATRRVRGAFSAEHPPREPDTSGPEPEPSVLGELAALPARARGDAARGHVTRLLAAQLGHAHSGPVRETSGFFELGLDSIMAVDLAGRLCGAFGPVLGVTDIFDHPTVGKLTDHLMGRLAAAGDEEPATLRAPVKTGRSEPRPAAPPGDPGAAAGGGGSRPGEAIAIVGMACRFPQADSVDELWDLLRQGRDGVGPMPEDRQRTAGFDPGAAGDAAAVTTGQGGFLRDIARFDAAFFGIPVREAENLDPQQRLLLETAWHALEDGGIDPSGLKNSRTGVFIGISNGDYARVLARGGAGQLDAYYSTGTALSAAAGRISYVLGLSGPAIAVDTACSSSLVALHLAVRSLRSEETDAVLLGGVNVIADALASVAVSRAHMLSPSGRCRTFSADADGFVRSEGCGVLVLKRLGDAQRDRDRVLAVVRGSAVNQDGASSGLTAPNGAAQEAVLRAALRDGATTGQEVSYLEAHGTGTALGDPVELSAAWRVLGPGRPAPEALAVGSVKSNIGHCESASGMAALIKTVLALRHGVLPANLHYREPNPHLNWSQMNVRVVDTLTSWRPDNGPRVAGVSGFGFTGTNAHAILAEAPGPARAAGPAGALASSYLLPLSAPSPDGLERLAAAWAERLGATSGEELAALAATAGAGRAHFPYRQALLGQTPGQLLASLRAATPPADAGRAPRVAFLFSGQGSQYFGMGRDLYETEPVFRDTFDTCDRLLAPSLGAPLAELMFYGRDQEAIHETRVTQPALVTLEIALTALWASWGITPAAVMGHSVGEIAATVVAGVMDLPTGLTLIAERARVMDAATRGAMLSVGAPEAEVAGWAEGRRLDIAAVNGPAATVVSGASGDIGDFAAVLRERGVRHRPLRVSHAFHSRLMDPALGELAVALAPLEFRAPAVPVISNLTGRLAASDEYTVEYWCQHARRPVRFHDGARQLSALGIDACLEIGPDRTLVNLVTAAGLVPAGGFVSSLRRGSGDHATLLAAARALYLLGGDLAWNRVNAGHRGAPGAAPRYPFAGTRYWTRVPGQPAPGQPAPGPRALPAPATVPAWGIRIHSPALRGRVFTTERSADFPPHLTDHRLYGTVSVPGASQVATALSALAPGGAPFALEDLYFPRALVLRDGERYELQIIEAEQDHGGLAVSVQSLVDPGRDHWQEHLTARVASPDSADPPAAIDPEVFIAAADRQLAGDDFYRHFRAMGYLLGPSFRWIRDVWIRGDEAVIRYAEPAPMNEDPAGYEIHPGLLDSLLQSAVTFAVGGPGPGAAGDEPAGEEPLLAVPFAAATLSFPGRPVPGRQLWGHVRATRAQRQPDGLLRVESADLHLFDDTGMTVLAVTGFRVRRAPRAVLEQSLRAGVPHAYGIGWAPEPRRLAGAASPGSRRVAIVGAGETGHAVRAAFAALGHQVRAAGRSRLPGLDVDLVVDTRFCAAPRRPAPENVLASALRLTQDLQAAGRHIPFAVLYAAGDGRDPGAPMRMALCGLLAAVEAEQRDRRLLRVGLAAGWTAAGLAEVLARSLDAGIPETRLEVGDRAVRVARLVAVPGPARRAGRAPDRTRESSALLTGGLGALGLSAARFLAGQGVRSMTLMARSAPDRAARRVIDDLTDRGVRIHLVRGDVTELRACRRAVAKAGQDAPLRIVFHLAGSTRDEAFEHLTPATFQEVFAAKARGAANLAAAAGGQPLDAFVLFSSIASVLGAAGQAAYAAANGYLDGLAASLRAAGVPATSINWGPWIPQAKGGLAASAAAERASRRVGVRPLVDEEADELLRLALDGERSQLIAVALDRDHYLEQLGDHPSGRLLDGLAARSSPPAAAAGPPRGWLRELLDGLGPEGRHERLRATVTDLTGDALGDHPAADDERGFTDMGLDSIMLIDLRARLSQALGVELPATVAVDYPTIQQVSDYVISLLFPGRAPAGGEVQEPARQPLPSPAVDRLSFKELVRAVRADLSAG